MSSSHKKKYLPDMQIVPSPVGPRPHMLLTMHAELNTLPNRLRLEGLMGYVVTVDEG